MSFATISGESAGGKEGTLQHQLARAVSAGIGLIAFLWMAWIAYTQFVTSRWYLADVGNIWYCLLNTLHGHFMLSPMTGTNHFAYHFTPFLLLLVWLPLLSNYPIPLVLSYVAAIALCALPPHRLSERRGLAPPLRPLIVLLFLSNHFTGSLELANHFEAFYVLFALCTMAWALRPAGVLFALLAAAVREDGGLWIVAWAVLEAFLTTNPRNRVWYLRLAALSAFVALAAFCAVVGFAHFTGRGFLEYLPRVQKGRLGIDTLWTLATLYASFLCLPLVAGRLFWLTLIPTPLLLASFPFLRQLLYYYSYPFLPYLALATVEGMWRVQAWAGRHSKSWSRLVAILVCLGALIQWLLPTRTDGYRRWPFEVTARDWYRLEVARELLPRDAPVAIQFGLWGVTPARLGAKPLDPRRLEASDYVFMDFQSPHGLERETFIQLARQLLREGETGVRPVIHRTGDLYILGPATKKETLKP
ncbi:MAG: DUF2079 domain-containing protein [Candidatus Sumerlaea chitinivorans]|nr:DUF2079 domain-containing protein [Candidatus Sumerlaea chitinivorans]